VRVQNRIKSLLQSRGVQVAGSTGSTGSTASGRTAYLDQLPAEARALAEAREQIRRMVHGD